MPPISLGGRDVLYPAWLMLDALIVADGWPGNAPDGGKEADTGVCEGAG